MDKILSVRKLSKVYGATLAANATRALDGVSFEVALAHTTCAINQVFGLLRQLGRASVVGYSVAAVAVFVGIYLLYFALAYLTARGVVSSRTRLVRE